MGTPDKTLLEILIPNTEQITTQKWIEAIEHRKAMMLRYFNRFTLQRLMEVECVVSSIHGIHGSNIFECVGSCLSNNLSIIVNTTPIINSVAVASSLSVQGVFSTLVKDDHSTEQRQLVLWGLTRDGAWVMVTLDLEKSVPGSNLPASKINKISIDHVGLSELLEKTGVHPYHLIGRLDAEVNAWYRKCSSNLDSVSKFLAEINMESKVIEHLYLKPLGRT